MLKNIFKKIIRIGLGFVVFVGCWLLCAWLLPYIKVGTPSKAKKTISLFIKSNGVHTDIVMPKQSSVMNWKDFMDEKLFTDIDSTFNYLSIGWGDRGFYIDTPTWADLKTSTAINAVFGLGSTAMHVAHYQEMKASNEIIELKISEADYLQLVNYIKESFEKKNNLIQLISHPSYGKYDNYFEAKGTYSLFKTCNVWAGGALKQANVPIGIWTPLSFGIMDHLK